MEARPHYAKSSIRLNKLLMPLKNIYILIAHTCELVRFIKSHLLGAGDTWGKNGRFAFIGNSSQSTNETLIKLNCYWAAGTNNL